MLRNAASIKIHSGFGLRTSVFPKISALPKYAPTPKAIISNKIPLG